MGCTGSQEKATPYSVCLDAYQNMKPIDIHRLEQALNTMEDPKAIDFCKEPYMFSALSLSMLNSNAQPEAAKLLLGAGADMFATKGSDRFHSSPLGVALKYDCDSKLEVLLMTFKQQEWDRFIAGVMEPPDITGGGVGVAQNVLVCVHGRRAKTKIEVLGINTGKETTVTYDDGTEATVNVSEIRPIPVVPAKCKALLIKVAESQGCGDEVMVPLRLLEEGSYGTEPRGWGTLAVLSTGAMGLQLFDVAGGALDVPAGALAGAAVMAVGM